MTFAQMITHRTTMKPVGGVTGCNNSLLDYAPNIRKQCFCEHTLTAFVQDDGTHDSGKLHHCGGDVYYVRRNAGQTRLGLNGYTLSLGHAKLM